MHVKPSALVLHGAVVVALIGGTAAYATLQKTVTVRVDGQTRQVHTFAGDVEGVLHSAGISVDAHDAVSPSLDSSVHDGSLVAVRSGRPLTLTVDGYTRTVWVTASSVDEALDQVGLRTNGALLSADRSTRVPLDGLAVSVRLPRTITVEADGKSQPIVTTAYTVGGALAEGGITLGPRDTVSVPLDSEPTDGLDVSVVRVTSKQVTQTLAIGYKTERRADSSLYKGTTRVARDGKNGTRVRTYAVRYANGKEAGRTLVSDVVTAKPVNKVIAVGTKKRPVYHPRNDGLNWAALARCESGGDPRKNTGNGFYGAYQFMASTWHRVGGQGLPSQASLAEQTYRAQILLSRSSWQQQWPVCGVWLFR